MYTYFPFTAIVGQKNMKLALILALINPKIGGVLIQGEKGTGKSTIVRSIHSLLPLIKIYTLPLSSDVDNIIGGIDLEKTIKSGQPMLESGIISKANSGILYIDEVNLLHDYLVETILSAVSSGINIVEREGISKKQMSNFILIGSMNPEEGDIRSQLLDRFGLCVNVKGERDIYKRVKILDRRIMFEMDPKGFIDIYKTKEHMLGRRILMARNRLKNIYLKKELKDLIVKICMENNVSGHRAEIIMAQAAMAYAAFKNHKQVTIRDINSVAEFVLYHRRRKIPQNNHQDTETKEKTGNNQENKKNNNTHSRPNSNKNHLTSHNKGEDIKPHNSSQGSKYKKESEKIYEIGAVFKTKDFAAKKDRLYRKGSGRRSKTLTSLKQGRYIRARIGKNFDDIAIDATIRAAAPYQLLRKKHETSPIVIKQEDIRQKVREKKVGNLLLFVVDASGSMGAKARMIATKGAIMSLLLNAYQKRDKVGMITFRRRDATLVLPPTSSVEMAAKLLKKIPVGGKTPLSHALVKAADTARIELIKDPSIRPILIIITDGKANIPLYAKNPIDDMLVVAQKIKKYYQIEHLVIDTEDKGRINLGLGKRLADILGGYYFKLKDIKADDLVNTVREII